MIKVHWASVWERLQLVHLDYLKEKKNFLLVFKIDIRTGKGKLKSKYASKPTYHHDQLIMCETQLTGSIEINSQLLKYHFWANLVCIIG